MANVLIIDDDEVICDALSNAVKHIGHEVTYALTLKDGINAASSGTFDVVFLGVRMPDGSGLDVLPMVKETPSSPEVIIITGEGDPDGVELAIKSGAWDYIEKPFSMEKFKLPLIRALQYRDEKKAKRPPVILKREGIVGNSVQMRACFDVLTRAAISDAGVLITGETGTGKELFARAIHDNSRRANKNFVVVDCAALPETLVQSVLFGHEKGAFTGADRAQDGLIKQAHGGTLFLDEIGELPVSVQKAFLRVLQEHSFRPVGGKREIKSDFRLVVATNRDLDQMTQAGRFRKDLLFRLQSITIELSPLRERREDIKELALFHMAKICERQEIGTKGFSPEFLKALEVYDWSGNVRELINILGSAIASARYEPTLFPVHLPTHVRIHVTRASVSKEVAYKGSPIGNTSVTFPKLKDVRETAVAGVERRYFQDLMLHTGGNIKEACRLSGIARARLYELLKKYKISREA